MCNHPHDNWADVYDEAYAQSFGPLYTMLTNTSLKIIQEKTELGAEILDIGAGTGRLSIPLLERGYSICAVDASPKMLEVLQKKDIERAIRTINSPVQELDLNQTFDAVLCVFSVFCYLTNQQELRAAIQSIARHTSNTGYALIDIPGISSFSGLSYESKTLKRYVYVTDLDPQKGLFEYSENITFTEGGEESSYEDNFKIRCWDDETILDEFELAGMSIDDDVSERFRGSGAHYFVLVKNL